MSLFLAVHSKCALPSPHTPLQIRSHPTLPLLWPPQGRNAAYDHRGRAHNWDSDSESEMSEYSLPRSKRQLSEHGSDCGAEQQSARPSHPPPPPPRTHAHTPARPPARLPPPSCYTSKDPGLAGQMAARSPPPPSPLASPCIALPPLTSSYHLLQVRPTTCRPSSVTTRRARAPRRSGPGAAPPLAAPGRAPRGSAATTR